MGTKRPRAAQLPAQVVEPFETAEGWAAHLAAQVEALAPANGVELALVERVAALLWRLRRIDRWEGRSLRVDVRRWHTTRACEAAERRERMRQIGRPDLAAGVSSPLHPDDVPGQLDHVEGQLRAFRLCTEGKLATRLSRDEATAVIYALGRAAGVGLEDRRLPGLAAPFSKLEGVPAGGSYTVALARRWARSLARAGTVEGGAATLWERAYEAALRDFRETFSAAQETTEALDRAHVAADRVPDRWADMAEYEAHLSTQLAQTLGQLERLQARRTSGPGPLPLQLLDAERLALPRPLAALPAPPADELLPVPIRAARRR